MENNRFLKCLWCFFSPFQNHTHSLEVCRRLNLWFSLKNVINKINWPDFSFRVRVRYSKSQNSWRSGCVTWKLAVAGQPAEERIRESIPSVRRLPNNQELGADCSSLRQWVSRKIICLWEQTLLYKWFTVE